MSRCSPWTCAMLCLVAQSRPTLCDPIDCSPSGSSVHWDSPGKNTGVGSHSLLEGIFPTQVSRTAGRFSLPAEPPGKPKNTGVGSLSLLQWIFPPGICPTGLKIARVVKSASCSVVLDSL